jgi:alkanesulfonate monooxygenase
MNRETVTENTSGRSHIRGAPAERITAAKSSDRKVEVFSTCPESSAVDKNLYVQNIIDAARWSEEAGCSGILVYSDNSLLDAWMISHIIIQNTKRLSPLVAVQPVYMHPYTVAKMVASFAQLYGRRVYLNMIAGGFKNDLTALHDTTPHDQRYDRLVEYTTIVKDLLASDSPVTYRGKYYTTDSLKLVPSITQDLFPGIFVSGSSEAGMAASRAIGGTAIKYPRPSEEETMLPNDEGDFGIRIGIITREAEDRAWEIAHRRFPEDRKGQITHQLAMKVSDSVWHKQLSELGKKSRRTPYWLIPFQNYKTMCPYLVGSYECVGRELSRYLRSGYTKFVLDIPPGAEELQHTRIAFERAEEMAK